MKRFLFLLISGIISLNTLATGEPSTYFEIFVPPNNDAASRDVCLIVTAIYDNTSFTITDDNMDGDTDDSVSGTLMAGQSYILYIRENGINDDAPHSGEGTTKQDGDYFIVESDNLVFASQSTNSDWQHDWVPATNKSSLGEKFIIYSPPTTYSKRDLNVFAYEDGTEITIKKISWANQTTSGYTNVDMTLNDIVLQKTINIGEDLIFFSSDGRDIMETGATYLVESNKPVSVQYGALWTNARDGGGYVPSANGSSAGELFYFAVPYQASNEQEIRIVSWDDNNAISLEKYSNGSWITVDSWNLNLLQTGDWVSYTGNINQVFRVQCSASKKVSVFEANWLETGSFGTSDIATMVSSKEGTTAGKQFLVYMAPPGNEGNVTDPFTGQKLSQNTHLYLFSRDTANITVKDAYSNGNDFDRSYQLLPGRYIDCSLNVTEWKSIYNGDGNPNSGPERPYLLVESDHAISVFNTNFNDNWMAYFGTSQTQDFSVSGNIDKESSLPGDTVTISAEINFNLSDSIQNPLINTYVGDGASVISSEFINQTDEDTIQGTATFNQETNQTDITFDNVSVLDPDKTYSTSTEIKLNVNYENGEPIPDRTVISVETIVSGEIDGVFQQSSTSNGVINETSDLSLMLFNKLDDNSSLITDSEDNWGLAFGDYDNDGDEDLFVPSYNPNKANALYQNNGDGSFTKVSINKLTTDKSGTITASWADYDNDGDLDLFAGNSPDRYSFLYSNNGNGTFSKINNDDIVNEKAYIHGCIWVDYNNDGYLDMFMADYMPTKYNKLYKNNGDGTFSKITDGSISQEANYSIGASWADYDNDGDLDAYIPNDKGNNNLFFNNQGNGKFTKITTGDHVNDGKNSTGCSWADYDNDGDLDLFVANASNQNNMLFNNNGAGSFTKVNTGDIVNNGGNSHGSAWGDVDSDGDLDLFVNNDQNEDKFLYLNNGDGTFTRNLNEPITSAEGNSMACAFADIENDGDLDLFIVTHSNEKNQLFINNGNSNNWLKTKLVGTNSNHSAIGAKVKVKANINGTDTWQLREISSQTGGGAGAQSSLINHFGLLDAGSIDSIIIEWPSDYIQYLSNQSVNQSLTITEDNGTLVKGIVFNDTNGNSIQDNDESGLSNVLLKIQPNERYTITNSVGEYQIYLETGDYTIEQVIPENWNQISPLSPSNYSVSITKPGQEYSGNNFANQGITLLPDLQIDLGATAFRRGFKNQISISYKNAGTETANNVILDLTLNDDIIALSADNAWSSQNSNTYTWNLGKLEINESGTINVTDSVNVEAILDAEKTINTTISSSETDYNPVNNNSSFTGNIVGSVDPNDLLVSPEGNIYSTENLNYIIRFENVGNYYASKVVIIDTLPEYLDMQTLVPGASSHPCNFTINNRVLTWIFDTIHLLPSSEDESKSQGFVQFKVKPDKYNSFGKRILNKAHIQFDFNSFIATNYTENLVLASSEHNQEPGELVIVPNPVMSRCQIYIKKTGIQQDLPIIKSIAVYNISGMKVFSDSNIEETNVFHLEISNYFNQGIYFVEITDELGYRYTGKLIVQ